MYILICGSVGLVVWTEIHAVRNTVPLPKIYKRKSSEQPYSRLNSITLPLFSPCIVNDHNLLVPTNAHLPIHIFQLIWLLHVSAGRHPQAAHIQLTAIIFKDVPCILILPKSSPFFVFTNRCTIYCLVVH
jgi:hypothetical protein